MIWIVVALFVVVGVAALIGVGAWVAFRAGDKLQRAPIEGSQKSATAGTRFAQLDKLLAEVRALVDKGVDDPELTASLGKHLDDLAAKKDAAADRLSDLDELLKSSGTMRPETRDAKVNEKAALEESLVRIIDALTEIKTKLTRAPDAADVTKGITDALSSMNSELDAQERARREIAALEKAR